MAGVSNSSGALGVTVGFEEEHVALGVRGTVDHSAVLRLSALFDAVIVSGYRSVVLDISELDLMDSDGLRAITYSAARLAASGGELTIRTASHLGTEAFDITRLSAIVRLSLPSPSRHRLGPEQSDTRSGTPDGNEAGRPVQAFGRITAVPADHDVVDGALRLVVALARATVGGADGVSVSLRRHGRLATVAATDQTISDMDANQYATGEGPCVDASVEGRWFHAESLDNETRWPAFTPRARALGINAILSSPLLAEDRPVGALNIYSRTATAFAPTDQELAAVFATEASSILTDAGVDVTDDQLARRLSEAQRVRQVIALAQGVIMEREGVTEDAAYTLLRNVSQETGRPLRERAEDVVASTGRSRPDPGPEGSLDG